MNYQTCEWGNMPDAQPCKKKARAAVEVYDDYNEWTQGEPVKVCREHAELMHSPMRIMVSSWPL